MTKLSPMPQSSSRPLDPDYVAIDITYRCNLDCKFCFIRHSAIQDGYRRELSLARWRRIVDALSERRREFYIAGGEPFLRPDLADLVRHIKRKGHRCLITTNGSLLGEKTTDALLRANVDELAISVHGDEAAHDSAVRCRGAFARIAAACGRIRASPCRGGARLSLWCTINPANHAILLRVYRALKALAPDHIAFSQLDFVAPKARRRTAELLRRQPGCGLAPKSDGRTAQRISVKKLVEQVAFIKAQRDPKVRFDLDLSPTEMLAWYDPRRAFSKKGFCLGQWKGLWLAPDGEAISCQPLNFRLGRVSGDDWKSVFNGARFDAFRRLLIKQGGFLPSCARCGRTSYSSAFYQDFIADAEKSRHQ
jgi:MoaA/NifB/PqqE/SkfB family radical SAM enzyme